MTNDFQYIFCPLCNTNDFRVLYKSTLTARDFTRNAIKNNLKNSLDDYTKHGQIVKCNTCELIYTNPRENIANLLKGYADVEDPKYLETEVFRKKILQNHFRQIKKLKKAGVVLDIGCFAGYFLSLAQKDGWKTYGVEPSIWAVNIAKKNKITIIGSNIYSTKIRENYFDVITLFDVIEHLSNPTFAVKKIHKSLKKNGIIAVATPNIESFFAKILGKNCPFLIRMHIVLFSSKTLTKLLEQNGYEILSMSYYGRTFPLSYFVDGIRSKNSLIKLVKNFVLFIPLIGKIAITLNFHDSILIIAKKKEF